MNGLLDASVMRLCMGIVEVLKFCLSIRYFFSEMLDLKLLRAASKLEIYLKRTKFIILATCK